MAKDRADHKPGDSVPARLAEHLPRPTLRFRRHAWAQFQRALDPLARPKPLRFGKRP